MRRWFAGAMMCGALVAATLLACGDASDENPSRPRTNTPPASGTPFGDAGDGINSSGAGAGSGAVTGLPCDVQQLFENSCIGCHLGPSPVALLTYDDLVKPSADPKKTVAQASLDRMKSTTAPMPPAPAVPPTPAEIATLEAWVNAGTPKGAACTTPPGGVDAGGGTNYNTPTVCTSNKFFPPGADNSASMNPGGACITCHSMRGGPRYTVAGTVYPTAHEPNDCNGVNAGLTVVVTDANGAVTNLPVNGVGNFRSSTRIAAPFKVKVTDGTKERVMVGTLTAGDCNTCHTEAGTNGAPGRVMAP
ncbi:MAG: hypothetical protein KC657_33260 [Myxococcales bacterium]|nr:hypothetical protein [Myxococcales bacterium]